MGFDPIVRFDGPVDTLGDLADHLVAVLREALSNIARHAHASAVEVTVAAGQTFVLRVKDNGLGRPAHRHGQEGKGLATCRPGPTNFTAAAS